MLDMFLGLILQALQIIFCDASQVGTLYGLYAGGVFLFCAHIYVPLFLAAAFGYWSKKWMTPLLALTVTFNLVMLTLPVSLPLLVAALCLWSVFYVGRWYWRNRQAQQQRARRQPRPQP